MGLIQALIEDGPKNAIQLAKATGTDKLLVGTSRTQLFFTQSLVDTIQYVSSGR